MEQQPQRLPGPAYITLALLLGLAVFIGWSIGSYPEQPAQRAVADSCKTITQSNRRAQQHQTPSYDLVGTEHNAEATDHNDTGDYQNEKSETDRRLADYTCQLAVYTANLAAFTKWLVIATIGLGIVGVWQGANIQRSVQVANRAADEAGDAIRAIQAGATAARTSARASQEANRINRDLLIATQRPWISVDLAPIGDLTYRDDGAYLQITCIMKNLGNTPAIYAWPRVCGVMQGSQNNAARQRESSWPKRSKINR